MVRAARSALPGDAAGWPNTLCQECSVAELQAAEKAAATRKGSRPAPAGNPHAASAPHTSLAVLGCGSRTGTRPREPSAKNHSNARTQAASQPLSRPHPDRFLPPSWRTTGRHAPLLTNTLADRAEFQSAKKKRHNPKKWHPDTMRARTAGANMVCGNFIGGCPQHDEAPPAQSASYTRLQPLCRSCGPWRIPIAGTVESRRRFGRSLPRTPGPTRRPESHALPPTKGRPPGRGHDVRE